MLLTAYEKQMQMDANMAVSIFFRRWITELSNQWFGISLGCLSELVIPRVTWTVSIGGCSHSERLIHFRGELGSTSHLILIDVTVLGSWRKGSRHIIMDEYFLMLPFLQTNNWGTHTPFKNKNLAKDHKISPPCHQAAIFLYTHLYFLLSTPKFSHCGTNKMRHYLTRVRECLRI